MTREISYRRAWMVCGSGRRPGYSGFWVEWYEGRAGAWRRRRLCLPTARLAREFAARRTAELNAPLFGQITWTHMIDAFMAAHAHLAEASIAEYARTLGHFKRLSGPRMAHEITPDVLHAFFAARAGETRGRGAGAAAITPHTLRKDLRQLRVFFRFGEKQEPAWFQRDPSLTVRLPRPQRRIRRNPSADDLAGLLTAATRAAGDPLGWWLLIRLALETGLRMRDTLDLTWAQLSYETLDGTTRLVVNTIARKTAKEGLWAATTGLEKAIERRRHERGETTRLFGWGAFQRKAWNRISAAAGVKHLKEFKQIRGVAADADAELRSRVALAQHTLGHGSAATTRGHYLDHLRLAFQRAALLETLALPDYEPAAPPIDAAASHRPPARRRAASRGD